MTPDGFTLVLGTGVTVGTAIAGVAVWALPYGYNMGEPIERSEPDLVISDLSLVPQFFKGL